MARRIRNRLPEHLRIQPPRELCARCREWVSIEDIEEREDDNDYPHCVSSSDYECERYMMGMCDNCPRFNEW